MFRRTLIILALALVPFTAHAQLSSFSQDFEGMDPFDAAALADDGWLVYGIVYDAAGNFIYNYGPMPFPAPNSTADNKTNGFRFSLLTTGEGDANGDQGNVQLVTFSDYENTDHGNPDRQIESIFFQEQTIGAGDVDTTWVFQFDANNRDLLAPTTARAFIKTIDLNTGDATNIFTLDMSNLTAWGTHSISIDIIPELEGQLVQFGFDSLASNYDSSGILYDNISFAPESTVPVEICPDTATVTAGITSSGSSADICDEDSAIWTVQSTTFVAAFSPPPVAITFEGNTNPVVGGTDVTLRLVGGPEFGNDAAFIQLRMFNFTTGTYVGMPFIGQPDSDNTVYESTNPVADFVGPNGELRAEITCAKTVAGPVRLRMNQVQWQIQ